MRTKFVLALMSFAALVLAVTFYFKQDFVQRPPPDPAKTAVLTPPVANPGLATAPGSTRQFGTQPIPVVTSAATVKPPMTPEERQAFIEAETSRLQDLSTQDDPASLSPILNDLTNLEKEVRLAAIEATKQFGSKDAIPVLQADVAGATDTDEKIALLEAADFLSLPTLADAGVPTPPTPDQLQAIQEQRQRQAARKQYFLQKHAQDQNAPSPPGQNSQPPQ